MRLPFAAIACGMFGTALPAAAAVSVTVDPAASWLGFMNVSELPANGGGFVFGSGWGTADLSATFAGDTLTLAPNTVGDPDPFWYVGGGAPGNPGNKIMDANMFVELEFPDGIGPGATLTFSGVVLANTLTSAHTAVAFIRDFSADYSSVVEVTAPLAGGVFSISLDTIADPSRHVQYGFQTIGENVWITDVAPFGQVQVTAIPEASGAGSLALAAALIGFRRRRPTVRK